MHEHGQLPQWIRYLGTTLGNAGEGRVRGSVMYMDASTGTVIECYWTVVQETGWQYAATEVVGNRSLGQIQVDNAILRSSGVWPAYRGEFLLVGPIDRGVNCFTARCAWRCPKEPGPTLPQPTAPRPALPAITRRRRGTIRFVHTTGAFGFVADDQNTMSVFVHRSSLRPGVHLVAGSRVEFVLGHNGRGPTAFDVSGA
jgi:cold shock CspA family protein